MNYVIIGNGAAGIAAAEKLALLDPDGRVTILSAESHSVYSKCLLPELISGEIGEDRLYIRDKDFYAKRNIRIHYNRKVVCVDFGGKCVMAAHAESLSEEADAFRYDQLLIATGSVPIIPKIRGLEKVPYHTISTLGDARRIISGIESARKATIIGAGFVGLEVAFGLYRRGIEVTVIERGRRVLPTQLDGPAARILREALEEEGIRVFLETEVTEVRSSGLPGLLRIFTPCSPKQIVLSDGRKLKSDIVIVATGSRPNLDFLKETPLRIGNGIAVDSSMRTSIPDVYAAGDVVESVDAISGQVSVSPIWPNAVIQGEVAAHNMAGASRELDNLISMQNASEFREIPMISMGIVDPQGSRYEVLCDYRPTDGVYRKLVLQDDTIVGVIFLGDIRNSGVIGALMKKRADISGFKANLLNPNFGYSEVATLM